MRSPMTNKVTRSEADICASSRVPMMRSALWGGLAARPVLVGDRIVPVLIGTTRCLPRLGLRRLLLPGRRRQRRAAMPRPGWSARRYRGR